MWISGSYFDLTPCYDIYSGYVYVARYNYNSSFFIGGGGGGGGLVEPILHRTATAEK